MNIRELVGTSLLSSHLETREEAESAIDRVGAISRATKLGSALWRWKYAGDNRAAPSALSALLRKAQRNTKIYRHHRDFTMLQSVCKLVLSEWYSPNCRECEGAREFVDEERRLRIVCAICNGTGLHRFSDEERAVSLKIHPRFYPPWADHVSSVWRCLAGADIGTSAICRVQLERL